MTEETTTRAPMRLKDLPVAKPSDYELLSIDPQRLAQIKKNFEGWKLRAFDLERAGVPSGKGKPEWTLATAEGEEFAGELRGIVLEVLKWRTWYRTPYEESGGGTPPDCASDDAETGFGDHRLDGAEPENFGPHVCARCERAVWGSDRRSSAGGGQDCQERRAVFFIRRDSDVLLPTLMVLPPTSIGIVDKLVIGILGRGQQLHDYEVRFTLEKDKSKTGIVFSKTKIGIVSRIDPESAKKIEAFRAALNISHTRAGQVGADPTKVVEEEEAAAP